jgi:hypothetical protein
VEAVLDLDSLAGIASQSPYLAALLVMGWVFNRYHLESLRERKEILTAMSVERQESTASRERLIERYAAELIKSTEAQVTQRTEIHTVRGTLTAFMTTQDLNQREIMSVLHEVRGWVRAKTGGKDADST